MVRKNYDRTAKKGRLTPADVEQRMSQLQPNARLRARSRDCDLVIEAVFEDMALKKDVFRRLDSICKPGAILATNTSYLDVNEIGAVTSRPEDVIGLHFFSPANVMRLLEMVRGAKTAKDVVATCLDVARRIGKIATVVGVCPGFVGNRMLFARGIEANRLLLEGATPWQVDRVLYDFGMPMGPFAMSDLAGLDIGWKKETSKSSTLRELLCERGRLGQKNGKGYYVYDPETRASAPDPEVETLIEELARKQGIARRPVADQEILERCLYPMVNEGAKILEERIAIRAERHRRGVGQRLRLAGLPRRTDVLGRRYRSCPGCVACARELRPARWRALAARGAPVEAGGFGRPLHGGLRIDRTFRWACRTPGRRSQTLRKNGAGGSPSRAPALAQSYYGRMLAPARPAARTALLLRRCSRRGLPSCPLERPPAPKECRTRDEEKELKCPASRSRRVATVAQRSRMPADVARPSGCVKHTGTRLCRALARMPLLQRWSIDAIRVRAARGGLLRSRLRGRSPAMNTQQ